jgi:monoamine oxidase
MDTADAIVLLVTAPATAYRECLYRPRGQLARWIGDRYDIVARPGQRIGQAVQEGDVLLEVTLGHMGRGRCIILAAGDLELVPSRPRLPPGQLLLRPRGRAERSEPLPVEPSSYGLPGGEGGFDERPHEYGKDLDSNAEMIFETSDTKPFAPSGKCVARLADLKVAVVGGGLGGLMAARTLAGLGVKVTVYEARPEVGGRVRSDLTFAKGRITEAGAELVGSIHTRWCALAKEYGISLISRMDGDLYRGQQLQQRIILDRLLSDEEIVKLEELERNQVLKPMAELARQTIESGKESEPWNQSWRRSDLVTLDRTPVADVLEKRFGVGRTSRLWKAMELLLVNNNVSRLEDMSFLALLCLVRGGQTSGPDPLMGYWDKLEIYRCADGCQRLARAIAVEVEAHKGCRVLSNMGVRRIDLRPARGGVLVTARSTKNTPFDQWLREKIPANPLMETRPYDYLVFAVPPTVWGDIEITPFHPKDVIGLMGSGAAVKFFSNVKGRFWVEDGFAPLGGSLEIGQVWEGTDNQTRVKGQNIVLSVFTGSRTPSVDDYKKGLARLYPANPHDGDSGYLRNLTAYKLVDWSREPFVRTGYSSPRVGQVLTIGKELNEPFQGRLFFAGEHTQMDHFGYMEGAIRSGERAARLLIDQVCRPLEKPTEPALVAAAGVTGGIARVG